MAASIACLLTLLLLPAPGRGDHEFLEPPQETLSPFFFVETDDPDLDQLPLKSVYATVSIAGVIADVRIRQEYANEGERPLEATYIFPASTQAAVYGMEMTIGDRVITAEIREREQARQEYEEAIEEGRTASLLEQQRPNVFQMTVGNILPGDRIFVELSYTETLVPTEGAYEFVYPTVVGPRYSETPLAEADPRDLFVATPYTREGEPATYSFDIDVELNTGVPVQSVYSISHEVDVSFPEAGRAQVRLLDSDESGGNRDYILRYSLAGNRIETGLLLYEAEGDSFLDENFFLFMGQPPERVAEEEIPPREYIFVVDVSGSMRGYPLDVSKALLRDLIEPLRRTDHFNVMLFAGVSNLMSDTSLPASSENIELALEFIDAREGGGGTRLGAALERAMRLPGTSATTSRSIVIATDGYISAEAEVFDLIRDNLGEANVFAFGIGSSVNRHLIEGIARVGFGEPFVVTHQEEAEETAARFREYIRTPVLSGATLAAEGFDIYEVEPVVIPDLLAQRPVLVYGKWQGERQGTLSLRGHTGQGEYSYEIDVSQVASDPSNAALRYLWARRLIATLGDYAGLGYEDELRVQSHIMELGLTYNLLTAYTSFVAVDRVVRSDGTELSRVEQPLALPQGVSDEAVGDGFTTAVEEQLASASWFGRQFYLREGVWIDSEFTPGDPVIEYREVRSPPDELKPFASLQRDMIVVAEEQAYRLRGPALPLAAALHQNAPNPFNAGTTIRFDIFDSQGGRPLGLEIFDLSGRRVQLLTWEGLGPGRHEFTWDGRDEQGREAASGVYIYRLSTAGFVSMRKMMLLK
ncbi:MAG: VIT domain-containing protein [Gemmatimonadetes bacterium]|nr:VIT domain-containing protein [Gemmatimonadota bacterium]